MMNKYFLAICFLAICIIIFIKFKNFYNIVEGARNCDPNKPKVYNRGQRSAKTCQKLKENEATENLRNFKNKLSKVKSKLNEKQNEFNKLLVRYKELVNNVDQTIISLDCKEIKEPKYKLDCNEKKESDNKDDGPDEVDVGGQQSRAARDASKYSDKKFQF